MDNEEIKPSENPDVANEVSQNEVSQKKSFLQRIKDWLGFVDNAEDGQHEE